MKTLTDNTDDLHVTVGAGFTVNVSSGSTYALINTNTVGDTTTYTFDNAGDSVTLDVRVV